MKVDEMTHMKYKEKKTKGLDEEKKEKILFEY